MFYPQNLHTHTTFCDGKNDCEDTVLKAIALGFTGIGFSGHSHSNYIKSSSSMSHENTVLYKKEVTRLKQKYAGQIEIFCGLEFDEYSDDSKTGYEYIIGATHYLKLGGEFVGFDRNAETVKGVIDGYFDGDGLKFAKEYYAQTANLPAFANIDIVGHFDLITKNCELATLFDQESSLYKKYALDCFFALKEKVPVFEINTGAMARGYRTTPYPSAFLLKEMAKAGAKFVLGSDCHDNTLLDYGFEKAIALCKACGIKELQIFTKGGFKGLPLV